MASHTITAIPLADLLAESLPQNHSFKFYHTSTPPTRCAAIFAAPPNGKPERTYCESHFLNASITPPESGKELLFLAIEVLIYTTKHLTTLFVSKADSTGYLPLLLLPKSHASPLRSITTTFISYLIQRRQRPGKKLVLSLFARAQFAYLFPGSDENAAKHICTDRELIRWWCRLVDPILQNYAEERDSEGEEEVKNSVTAQGYLIVPGEDNSTSFLPPPVRANPALRRRWRQGHPFREISSNPYAPIRCLVPRFPDDPKSRYLDDLDGELPDASANSQHESPSKRGNGMWKSVKSLEQFWEHMAYRQECSSGNLTGFLWIVFTPPEEPSQTSSNTHGGSQASTLSQISDFDRSSSPTPGGRMSSPKKARRERGKLAGPIVPRQPRIKKAASELSTASNTQEVTPYYMWPVSSRGTIVLDEKEYKRATDLLLKLDFANRNIAAASTSKWIEEVGVLGAVPDSSNWGFQVSGRKVPILHADTTTNGSGGVTMLQTKRKAKVLKDDSETGPCVDSSGTNVLGAGLVRKKVKVDGDVAPEQSKMSDDPASAQVNVLGAGLIRKKPKA